MACGAPVVCSPETSLPEVAGDAAIYANARNPQEFAHALNRVFSSNDLRAELLARGYKNCQRFSWTRAAAQTIDLYEQAIAQEARQAVHA
jgi:glycosyltransferase involved in cell wall biosynthesis